VLRQEFGCLQNIRVTSLHPNVYTGDGDVSGGYVQRKSAGGEA